MFEVRNAVRENVLNKFIIFLLLLVIKSIFKLEHLLAVANRGLPDEFAIK